VPPWRRLGDTVRRHWGYVVAAGFAAVLSAAVALTISGSPASGPSTSAPSAPASSASVGSAAARPFAAKSFWNKPLSARAKLARGSAAAAARLAQQTRYNTGSQPVRGYFPPGYSVAINTNLDTPPVWHVPAAQPTVPVLLVDNSGQPRPAHWAHDLQAQFNSVPVPLDQLNIASQGTDAPTVIWQQSTDTMWEFWRFHVVSPGVYTAEYGARIQHVSTSSGVLPNQWGARATSLALAGGLLTMSDYLSGHIDHALAIAVPVITRKPLPPATRSDGPTANNPAHDARDAIPEGARFRLPASFNCKTDLPTPTKLLEMICVAARDYGLVVVDRSDAVIMFAENPMTVGTEYQPVQSDPWAPIRSSQLVGPSGVMNDFPWSHLQQLAPLHRLGG
jgi:hypothetical protein